MPRRRRRREEKRLGVLAVQETMRERIASFDHVSTLPWPMWTWKRVREPLIDEHESSFERKCCRVCDRVKGSGMFILLSNKKD
jgi:hypothetical protein